MTISRVVLPLFIAIGCRLMIADTLLLTNGQKIEGRYLSSTADVVFTFRPTCGPGSSVTFTYGYPVDQRSETRTARLSSPLAQKLRDALSGGIYRVSGHLFPHQNDTHSKGQTNSRQRFESAQPNSVANVTNPQYLVQFTALAPDGH